MAKKITDEKDVQFSIDHLPSKGSEGILKISEGQTPIYILSSEYEDGYVHWVTLPGGDSKRVICGGGLDGKGWAPDDCKICEYVQDLYKTAKKIENSEGETPEVKKLRKKAGGSKGRYEAAFIAAKGELIIEKRNGKKIKVPDFDEGEVGVLSMSKTQFEAFTSLRKDEKFEFMKGPSDLVNRVIILDKAKRDNSIYATTEFIPSKKTSEAPDLEYDEADFNLDERYEVNSEEIEKVIRALNDEEDDDLDEGLELEEDDFDLDDDEDDDIFESSVEDDLEEDDDIFEDDIPYEEEKPVKKEPVKKRTTTKKAATKKPVKNTANTKKATTKKTTTRKKR